MAEHLHKTGQPASLPLCGEAARFYQKIFSSIPLNELRPYLLSQRWFRSKGEKIVSVNAIDAASTSGTMLPAILLFLHVEYENRPFEIYFAPYIVLDSQDASVGSMEKGALLNAVNDGVEYLFFDAFLDKNFNGWLFKQMREAAFISSCSGAIKFQPQGEIETVPAEVKKMKGEQSNTSLLAGKRFMLKVLRRADQEINPEAEMLRFLTRRGYKNSPQFRGDAVYQTSGGRSSTFAILVDFVKSTSDGWAFSLHYLEGYYGRHAGKNKMDKDAAERDIKGFLPAIEELGRVTAEMHRALASDHKDPLFRPEAADDADLSQWIESFTSLLEMTRNAVTAALERKTSASAEAAYHEFLSFRGAICQKAEKVRRIKAGDVLKIRYHGDYHLGQVLKTEESWCVTDFEGEPLRTIQERKRKTSPLKDAAGMLRSFSYAAYVSEHQYSDKPGVDNLRTLGALWHDHVRAAFLNSYMTSAHGSAGLFKTSSGEFQELLCFFELEKAVYELNYEINNRPDWAYVPLEGIKRLVS